MKINTVAGAASATWFALVACAVAAALSAPACAAAGGMYGDPAAAANYWRQQQYDDCVLMSSADVVGELTGTLPSEQAIIEMAQTTPSTVHPGSIYVKPVNTSDPDSGMGADMRDVAALLAKYQVRAKLTDKDSAAETGIPTGIPGLEQALGAGRKVIASVNSALIWHLPVTDRDEQGNPQTDHAVVVTGVDSVNGIVHLNDSGAEDGRDEQVPVKLFSEAWDAGDDVMVVTT
ncbi:MULTISPECIES: hypothetical protein [unclassified Mycobacterium]|uniref:hypothetical protein n=1 Tax=unclassified Mycobacterium TaxID=2642494 RepID=UPI0007FBA006|nr:MULTISPECIES: hypothetical protein [unclassified Mycobacterium]OBG78868.1 hypothetical protein A5700_01390 [Mycobacterium sp. E1214]OBH28335.1 hypothetical protein A5693_22235 [Mycobacterium sp. E1319]